MAPDISTHITWDAWRHCTVPHLWGNMTRRRTGQQNLDRNPQDEMDKILGDIYKWQQFELVIDTQKTLQIIQNSTRWRSRRICTHLLLWELQNYNLLLNNCHQENVGSHQKKIPHVQGQRRSPSKIVGRAKIHLESNPIPTRDAQRAQTKPCVRGRPHRDWTRHDFECLSVSCRGTGQQWPARGRDSGCCRPGYGISTLGGGRH